MKQTIGFTALCLCIGPAMALADSHAKSMVVRKQGGGKRTKIVE